MCTLHYLCLVNTITTLIWQNFVSLFYNLIVYFTTKMSWSNCPLLRFSFLTQIIVCIIHSWFKSKSVQNNFKVAQVWFVFLFAQELSRNDQLSRTKEKNKLQVQNHFNTNSLSLTCTHTTWALEQLYKHCRAVLWEPSTLKLWNLGYPAYAFYQKTMIP